MLQSPTLTSYIARQSFLLNMRKRFREVIQ